MNTILYSFEFGKMSRKSEIDYHCSLSFCLQRRLSWPVGDLLGKTVDNNDYNSHNLVSTSKTRVKISEAMTEGEGRGSISPPQPPHTPPRADLFLAKDLRKALYVNRYFTS